MLMSRQRNGDNRFGPTNQQTEAINKRRAKWSLDFRFDSGGGGDGDSALRVHQPTIISTTRVSFICILVASCLLTAQCIRVTRIHPESDSARVEALLGSNLTLRCPFVLEGNDQLYSIKWHKKLNGTYFEFYSYSKWGHKQQQPRQRSIETNGSLCGQSDHWPVLACDHFRGSIMIRTLTSRGAIVSCWPVVMQTK